MARMQRPKADLVRVKLPDWIYGGNPAGVQDMCSWEMQDREGKWYIRNKEAKHGKKIDLIELTKLLDIENSDTEGAYGRLNRLKKYDGLMKPTARELAELYKQQIIINGIQEPATYLALSRMAIATSPTAEELKEQLKECFNNQISKIFPNSTCYLLEISTILGSRYSVIRSLIPEGGRPQARGDGKPLFSAARAISSETTFGLDPFVSCLFTSLSPRVWGLPVPILGGVLLFIFGESISGKSTSPTSYLELLAPYKNTPSRHNIPNIDDPSVFEAGAKWWVKQLNIIFSIITEPENYAIDSVFSPVKANQTVVTLEQFFRDCQSVATTSQDEHSRLTLAFQALYRLDGLAKINFKDMVSLNKVTKTIIDIEKNIPAELHCIFLPRARRALEALRDLQGGFFDADRNNLDYIEVPLNKDSDKKEKMPLENAAQLWLQIYRNSLHGFDKPMTPKHRAVWNAHTGEIPSGISDLAWVQLLSIMSQPVKLARFYHGPWNN